MGGRPLSHKAERTFATKSWTRITYTLSFG